MDTVAGIPWYFVVWPWVGLGAAIVLLVLLFATDVLRSDLTRSRWKDPTWLAWGGATAYLLHNVEEYGVDAVGTLHSFPKFMSASLNPPPPEIFYALVNIPMFWIVGPVAAVMSRTRTWMAAGMAGMELVNSFLHIGSSFTVGYNPGVLTSVVIFVPLALWTFHALYGPGRLRYSALAWIFGAAVIGHIVLLSGILLLRAGLPTAAAAVQLVNAALMLVLWYSGGKVFGGRLTLTRE